MFYFIKTLTYVDVLIAAGLILLRWTLVPRCRALVSNRLCAIALTMPAVALSGNLYLFYLYLAAIAAITIHSRFEFAASILSLCLSTLLLFREQHTHPIYIIVTLMLIALGMGTLLGTPKIYRNRLLYRLGALSWIFISLLVCSSFGLGQSISFSKALAKTSAILNSMPVELGNNWVTSNKLTNYTSIGINLYWNVYYSPEFPFLNRMKTSGAWAAQGSNSSLIPFTANGYPTGSPAGTTSLYTMVALDPITSTSTSTYVLTWTGSASFFIAGGQIISSKPGKIVFRFTRTDTNQTFVSVSGLDPSHPLDNMAIVRSDQVDLYNTGEIFNPAFISQVGKLGTLRYMDWSTTNTDTTSNWADRTTVSNRSWQSDGNSSVPIEVEVALANETKTNMWLNVPTYATDDYVRRMVTYVHDHLDPSLSLHLEYSNEVWNFSFQQAHYALTQGDKLWGTDANGDGVIDPNDPKEHYGPGWVTYYGYRAAQVANIANQVYGAHTSRLVNVLSTQTTYQGLEKYIISGVERANVGRVCRLFGEYAITTYFGTVLNPQNATDRATILTWARSGNTGLESAFAAIKDNAGITAPDTGSLTWLSGVLAYQGAEAQKLGLNLVAYEGGIDLTNVANGYGSDSIIVQGFVKRLHADARMVEIYTQMTSRFSTAGGKLLNVFTDVGAGYGTLNSIYDSGSPEWDALVAAQAAVRKRNAIAVGDMAEPTSSPPQKQPASPATP